MTRVDHLQICGFKAIDEVEVEPNQINIITGRNNTGKTSFLQAIDLLFRPSSISRFYDNLDCVINEDHDSSKLKSNYAVPQLTLDNYGESGDAGTQSRVVDIHEPTQEDIVDCFSAIYEDLIDTNEEYPFRLGHPAISRTIGDENVDDLKEDLLGTIHDVIAEIPSERIASLMEKDVLILVVDDKEYPYIHLGSGFDEIRDIVINSTVDRYLSELEYQQERLSSNGPSTEEAERVLVDNVRRILSPRFKGKNRFVFESPPEIEGMNFVSDPHETPENIDLRQENAAVRRSDIEDHLLQYEIVENLEDFSFDRIVFQDEDDKDEVPFEFMGSGFKTITGLLWELFDREKRNDVLLLEEPDVHMHPGYIEVLIRELIRFAHSGDIQLFITSHNIDLIEGFFSPALKRSHGDFLTENLTLFQMSDAGVRDLSYNDANEELEKLNSDLRGI